MTAKPRTLVTGGAGFLGSHLCDRLLAEGHEVVCADNLITGSADNIAHLLGRPDFRFLHQDVTEYLYLEGPLDYLLHFASPASPVDYLRLPIQTLKVGSIGTHKALGLAKAKGARFLLASTSEVYGDPQVHPQPEAYWGHVNPVGPRGVYDEAKRFAEALSMAYHRAHGVATRIVSGSSTPTARMRPHDGRVVSNFCIQALAGTPLTVYGDGSQTRSFCYVADTVEGILRVLLSDEVDPVNIGNPTEFTIAGLVATLEKVLGRALPVTYAPLPQDDPRVRQPDIARAQTLLGWRPQVDLETGLRETLAYFQGRAAG